MSNDYHYEMCDDGDYVLTMHWVDDDFTVLSAWLIPGTQLED